MCGACRDGLNSCRSGFSREQLRRGAHSRLKPLLPLTILCFKKRTSNLSPQREERLLTSSLRFAGEWHATRIPCYTTEAQRRRRDGAAKGLICTMHLQISCNSTSTALTQMDPSLRWDDIIEIRDHQIPRLRSSRTFKVVIPAQAGIQWRPLHTPTLVVSIYR